METSAPHETPADVRPDVEAGGAGLELAEIQSPLQLRSAECRDSQPSNRARSELVVLARNIMESLASLVSNRP